jgi:branched-chain amino acid transport system ATP-binding protein
VTTSPAEVAGTDVATLEAADVTVKFGALSALSEVSFTVEPGTIHAVIGPNGAGKSTMLNVLSGVYRATAGEVRFGDEILTGKRPHQIARLGVTRAFQNIALSAGQTVAENLMLGRHSLTHAGFLSSGLRLPRATREGKRHGQRVRDIADFMDLGDKLETPVGVLPYGDQKRVEVARALCTEPRMMLLDEPVAGMNDVEAEELGRIFLEVAASGIAVLLIEHNIRFVTRLCEQVHVLDYGRVIASGTPRQVMSDPAVIAAYLGS